MREISLNRRFFSYIRAPAQNKTYPQRYFRQRQQLCTAAYVFLWAPSIKSNNKCSPEFMALFLACKEYLLSASPSSRSRIVQRIQFLKEISTLCFNDNLQIVICFIYNRDCISSLQLPLRSHRSTFNRCAESLENAERNWLRYSCKVFAFLFAPEDY